MTHITKLPLIKWNGSKRKQAPYIVDQFPKEIDTYYECFLGGGSVLHELLNRVALGEMKVNKVICSDVNKDLIGIFNIFKNKDTRKKLFEYYCALHKELVRRADIDNTPDERERVKKCQTLYYEMRDKMNNMSHDDPERPYLFYWIMRTCFNGLVRYNPKTGNFNASFHVGGRFGIKPEELEIIFESWGDVIDDIDIEFINESYDKVIADAKDGDVVYMDPPYENTGGMYFCTSLDTGHMYDVIENIMKNGAKVLLSYDGFTGDADDRTADVRKWYKRHVYVNSGHSSFKKLKSKSAGTANKDIIKDSLYISY